MRYLIAGLMAFLLAATADGRTTAGQALPVRTDPGVTLDVVVVSGALSSTVLEIVTTPETPVDVRQSGQMSGTVGIESSPTDPVHTRQSGQMSGTVGVESSPGDPVHVALVPSATSTTTFAVVGGEAANSVMNGRGIGVLGAPAVNTTGVGQVPKVWQSTAMNDTTAMATDAAGGPWVVVSIDHVNVNLDANADARYVRVSGTRFTISGGETGFAKHVKDISVIKEDVAAANGDPLFPVGVVRVDTPGALPNADGDYGNLRTDAAGKLWVQIGGSGSTNLAKPVNSVAGGTDEGIAPLVVRDDALTTLAPVDGDYVRMRVDSVGALWTRLNAAIPAGTNYLGRVGKRRIRIAVKPTITAGAYGALDAVGGGLTFANAVAESGKGGTVVAAYLVDDAGQSASGDMSLLLFNQSFTPTADNAGIAISEADGENSVGFILFDSTNNVTTLNGAQPIHLFTEKDVGLGFVLTGTSLFGQLVCQGAPTYDATDDLTVILIIEQD